MKNTDLNKKLFYRQLFTVAFPVTIQSLMLALVATADTLMLGSLDQNSMSAVSMATQVQFIQNMVISSSVFAFSILGAQYWGKGDQIPIHKIFFRAMRICIVVSALFFAGCCFYGRQLMSLYTNEEILITIGVRYLKIAGWSYLLTGISQCYLALLKITEHSKESAIISSACVIINIVLNGVFIFGLFGIPAMGVEGAAIATLIARIIELGWCIVLSMHQNYFQPKWNYFLDKNQLLAKDFKACMMPILGASLLWGIGFSAYTAFMGHLGTDAAAANSVSAVVRDLLCCYCNGISTASAILLGNEMGAGHLNRAKQMGDLLVKIAFICGFVSTGVMLLLTPAVCSFVKLTEGAHRYLTGMMIIMAFYMIGRCVNTVVINGIFDAGGDTAFDLYSLAIVMWGIAVPLAALGTFVFHWPVLVIYACTCLDEVGKIPWVMIHYKKYKWVKNLTRESQI